jgi:uncharacterized membrane protein YebE (DUF533 family)
MGGGRDHMERGAGGGVHRLTDQPAGVRMSLKNMMMKMALAFVAAKGVQAYRSGGGMDGMKRQLDQQRRTGSGLGGLLGGLSGGGAGGSGGLAGLMGSLGMGGTATGGARHGNTGFGGLLGGLAGAAGGAGAQGRMQGLLDTTRADPHVDDEAAAALMIRAMVQAAKADGEIDTAERRIILDALAPEDAQDAAFIEAAITRPVDVEALAADVPEGLEIEVYTASVMAIEPDNRAEAEYLDKLAKRLRLAEATVNEIHAANGKPALYSA